MAPPKILIVEDETIIAIELEDRLANIGYEVVGNVATGEAALREITRQLPDIILMDVHLKGAWDGIETAEEIQKRFDVPIVYLTAYTDNQTVQRAKTTTPYGYLLKPFREDELRTTLEIALYKHQVVRELREQAILDSLTGAYNRRFLDEALTHEFYRAQRNQTPLSVAMLDIDFLKQVNDTYGHHAGDHMINTVAQILRNSLRKSDIVCRYGGDEMALILPDTPLIHGKNKLVSLLKQINGTPLPVGDNELNISISAGIATAPDHADTPNALLQAADKALYLSKRLGRNQVHSASEIT